jgi:hypothetical protein
LACFLELALHGLRQGLDRFLGNLVAGTETVDLVGPEPPLLHGDHVLAAAGMVRDTTSQKNQDADGTKSRQ